MSDISLEELPTSINPYQILGLDEKATADQIRSAYKKQALRNHPDKVAQEQRGSAHQKFQEISFAYAILSDERRRRRYDTTGSTAESLDLDEDDSFNWADYFRSQYANVVNGSAIDKLKAEYQGGEEERQDILAAYRKSEGNMDVIYETVLLSNPLDDDDRFRKIIQNAIDSQEVDDYPKFSQEPKSKRKARLQKAEREAEEADELAEELGIEEKLGKQKKGKHDGATANKGAVEAMSGKSKKTSEDELAAIINQRHKSRASTFLSDLETKYATPADKKRSSKKRTVGLEEPPEEAFAATAARKQQKNTDSTSDMKNKRRNKKAEA